MFSMPMAAIMAGYFFPRRASTVKVRFERACKKPKIHRER
jgi:hypothetical protein